MAATAAWLASIEALLNRSLAGSAQAAELTRPLAGTALDVDIIGWMRIRLSAGEGRIDLRSADAGGADAVISGSPLALWQLLKDPGPARRAPALRGDASGGSAGPRESGPGAGVRAEPAMISGDAEVANLYRRLLARARPDLEEELSRWIGDFPARRVAVAARAALGHARRVIGIARQNLAEYLQEESRDLVNGTELDEFVRGVDEAREAADRIAARIVRIAARIEGSA